MKPSTLSDERASFLADDFERGFIRFCRIRAEAVRWGFFQSKVEIDKIHRQQDGFVHAGLMATMADHTAGYSAFTIVEENQQILTIEFKINFLKPAHGDALTCRSTVIRGGRRIIISESDIYDLHETREVPVAKALVTLMAVPAEKILNPRQSVDNRFDHPSDLIVGK
jgi:uncharacterized protein (TIGR00369 family)